MNLDAYQHITFLVAWTLVTEDFLPLLEHEKITCVSSNYFLEFENDELYTNSRADFHSINRRLGAFGSDVYEGGSGGHRGL